MRPRLPAPSADLVERALPRTPPRPTVAVRASVAARAESGRIMVLLVGLVSVLLSLTLVIAGATSLHVERKRLLALTDAAATYAASSLDSGAYFRGARPRQGMPISDAAVRGAVADYLASPAPGHTKNLDDVRIAAPTGSPDAATATVTLRARLKPAVLPATMWDLLGGIPVSVTVTAHAQPR